MNLKLFIPLLFFASSLSSCGQNVPAGVAQQRSTTISTDTTVSPTRNFTRFEKEIQKFEESDKISAPKQGSILFVGSSSIRLWKSITEDFSPLPVINRGFGGATIGEVNYYFRRIVSKYNPRFVVFYAGENDLFHPEISVDSVLKDFNHFRDSMQHYLPECKMYFISVKPSPARWAYQAKFTEANNRFRAICEADPSWTYIDVVPRMLNDNAIPRKEIFRSDSLHMNSYGYADWSQILNPYLKEAWKTSVQVHKAR